MTTGVNDRLTTNVYCSHAYGKMKNSSIMALLLRLDRKSFLNTLIRVE